MSKVAVIGAGTMGNGIAHVFAQNGWQTLLIDVSSESLKKGLATIKNNTERQVTKGTLTPEDRHTLLGRITTSTNLEHLGKIEGIELVVEAATENPEIKFEIFENLDRLAPQARSSRPTRLRFRSPKSRSRRYGRAGHRDAFHESGAGDEARRGNSWTKDVERDRQANTRNRQGAGQDSRSR